MDKAVRGQLNNLSGHTAEEAVIQKYKRCGFEIIAQRYRKACGEIDVIARHAKKIYFIEVKKARHLADARTRITPKQINRIRQTADHFLGALPFDPDRECRFDAACVDQFGRIEVIPGAF